VVHQVERDDLGLEEFVQLDHHFLEVVELFVVGVVFVENDVVPVVAHKVGQTFTQVAVALLVFPL